MRLNTFTLIVLLVVISKIETSKMSTSINIKETVHISLEHNQTQNYELTLPQSIPEDRDLYIRAEPSFPDPLQLPFLIVTSD